MGEAKRRKVILGDEYGKSEVDIEIGSFQRSDVPEISCLVKKASGIIDRGIFAPFVLKAKDLTVIGLGFPSVKMPSPEILVGLIVLASPGTGGKRKEINDLFNNHKAAIRRKIGIAFKEKTELHQKVSFF